MNSCFFIGNLGKAPELRSTQTGRQVCNFSIAVNERFKRGENWETKVEWINIVVWGKTAEYCGQNLLKGHKVFVAGKLQTRKYEDKSGVTRYITEILASRVEHFAGSKAEPDFDSGQPGGGAPADDDIPF